MEKKLAVVAVGGNSLITDKHRVTVDDQYKAAAETCKHFIELMDAGYKLVITHGNGPQVGFILRRAELAKHELHMVPLDSCGADTQGAIGYQIQKALYNQYLLQGREPVMAATVVTQTIVDTEDPSFKNPTKPIGSFMDKDTALAHQAKDSWSVVEDAGRGWRRVVASPLPVKIVEYGAIKTLIDNNVVVIAVGGGGIPVVERDGELWGAEAVIDKDFGTCLLAKQLSADAFIISTAIDKVYINFGKENQQAIDQMTVAEAEKYIEEGHFAPGSMLPKIKACIDFVKTTGNKAIITNPEMLALASEGKAGTTIVP
ncbi:MAG: carbamate kinase [Vampirovibrionia bacterium]